MSKKYDETKVKPATSTPPGPKGTNESKIQVKRRKFPNFNDERYSVKTVKTRFLETGQQPSKLRNFLKSIPIIGRFLAKVFTPEKIEIISNPICENREAYEAYKRSRNKYHSKAKDEAKTICTGGKHEKVISSKVKQGSVEQVEHEEKSRDS
ncbi:hypothetical protein GO685_00050 [Wolbachia endosymbiont of Madathamugadia hiepei]|uniref:hypothetical protein n=1 Tax=Wolbachia endosymbiont of Madathamugadia hiepei TaxID=1241303 RepID=UPI00158A24E4|nr:hypothetical protein [Wolbachia endosymbiont of Madathamugadia hiepei]NUX00931.1 hypothetical protein [Wolbachia endosymbiont of Madathamugadia hiepei]